MKKIENYIENSENGFDKFELVDGDLDLSLVRTEFQRDFRKLISLTQITEEFFKENLSFNFLDTKFTYMIPFVDSLSFMEGEYCFDSILENMTFENFVFTLMSILHERSIIYISKNLRTLSNTM